MGDWYSSFCTSVCDLHISPNFFIISFESSDGPNCFSRSALTSALKYMYDVIFLVVFGASLESFSMVFLMGIACGKLTVNMLNKTAVEYVHQKMCGSS